MSLFGRNKTTITAVNTRQKQAVPAFFSLGAKRKMSQRDDGCIYYSFVPPLRTLPTVGGGATIYLGNAILCPLRWEGVASKSEPLVVVVTFFHMQIKKPRVANLICPFGALFHKGEYKKRSVTLLIK